MARRDGRRSGGRSGRGKRKLPTPETVVSEATVVSPKGRVYRILRTTQTDPYDAPATAPKPSPGGTSGDDAGPAGGGGGPS
jgi:hypothetical protein